MLVAAGEALAADGTVKRGTSAIDNSMITGESNPDPVVGGDSVLAGAINLLNPIYVRVDAVAQDTMIAAIARLMDEAGRYRGATTESPTGSRLYAPVVHTLALLALIGWLAAGAGLSVAGHRDRGPDHHLPLRHGTGGPRGPGRRQRCAARTGRPGEGRRGAGTSRRGRRRPVDKTGTLTLGQPVPDLASLDDTDRRLALSLAQTSRHPLSYGLAKALARLGVKPVDIDDAREIAGRGMTGRFQGEEIALERPDLAGTSPVCMLRRGTLTKPIRFSDPLRSDAASAVSRLAEIGLQPAILSGDRPAAVAIVAEGLGITGVGGLHPAEKLAALEKLKHRGAAADDR